LGHALFCTHTELELIKDFGRDTVLRNRALAYYNFTEALSRHMPIDLALDDWRDALERLREMLRDSGDGPEGDDDAGRHRRLLTELVEKAEAECRAHEETLHLLDSPANAKRLADAIAAADSGLAREMTPEELRTAGGHQD
jgi:hypothetical protein